jgi:adenosylcobinamide-GDP ribazoletransferase
MRAFWIAWQLLTRLPAPAVEFSARAAGRSVVFYPAIGLVVGAVLAGVQAALAGADVLLVAALIVVAWVAVTGGLHLDGLADSADAWAGSHGDRRRALAIMKDSRSGPAGVTVVVLILLAKFAALTVLVRAGDWPALIAAPLLGRTAIVFLFLTTSYVRRRGLGAPQAAHLPRGIAWAVSAAAALVVAAGMCLHGAWVVGAALLVTVLMRRLMNRLLGGTTGDTLGAACEVVELVSLVTMALLLPVAATAS